MSRDRRSRERGDEGNPGVDAPKPSDDQWRKLVLSSAEEPGAPGRVIDDRALATIRSEVQAGLEPIREQIRELRDQLAGALTGALNKLAKQQVAFQQQLIDRQDDVLGRLVASSAAEGDPPAEQLRAGNRVSGDDLTALVRDELAQAAIDRQIFQQQLIDRQSEVLAKLANPLMAERNMQSKQMRAETRALRNQLTGFIGEQFTKLAKANDRLIAQQDAARSEPVTAVAAELQTALGQIRQETQQLREAVMATVPSEREATMNHIRREHLQLREEITRSVTDPITDRIAAVAEEHGRFRARLVAVARVVETRFDAFEAQIHARLDQVATAKTPSPRGTGKSSAPRAAAKKAAPRAVARKPAPQPAAVSKRNRRPS